MTGQFNFTKKKFRNRSINDPAKAWIVFDFKPTVWFIVLIFCIGAVYTPNVSGENSYNYGSGEVIELRSPVIWSLDGEADHVLDYSQNFVYESKEAIKTTGTVTGITANWEFEGQVTLEISADGGVNYQKILNGVPLFNSFTLGNKIKWRATLGDESRVTLVKIAYTDDSGVVGTFGEPELSGFKFRKSIKIDNPGGIELFNYQIRISVGESSRSGDQDIHCDGKIVSDFNDIRFTAQDGETVLPYSVEDISGTASARTAIFWVKVPNIPYEGAEIYMYYSKVGAQNNSTPDKVFDLYDDFYLPYINDDKWDIQTDLGGSYAVEDSLLELTAARIISKEFEIENGIIECKARTDVTKGKEIRAMIRYSEDPNLTQLVYSSVYEGAEHAIAVGNIVKENIEKPIIPGIFYYYRVLADGDKLTFKRSHDNFINTEVSVEYNDTDGLDKGFIGVETGGTGENGNVSYFDWIRVRKAADIIPSIGVIGAQETAAVPEFNSTGISSKGDIVFNRDEDVFSESGEYIVNMGSASYDINTIIPYMVDAGAGIKFDLSADGGVSWADNSINGAVYNSSEHFYAGQELDVKVRFAGSGISASEVEAIRVVYSMGPVVSSKHIYVTGAMGEKGMFIKGDTIKVEWNNSITGDNNKDIDDVYCNFSAFEGNPESEMLDKGNNADERSGDDIYSVSYTLPDDIANIGSIYVTAKNSTGSTTRDGHVLTVNTMPVIEAMSTEDDEQEDTEAEEDTSEAAVLNQLADTGIRPGEKLYDVVVKLGNNTDANTEGDGGSYKHGDVVVIRPTGHEWSETEKDSFLILQMYLTPQEKKELLTPEIKFTGRLDESGNWINKTVKKRAIKIDMNKFGLSRESLETGNIKDRLSRVKEIIKGKELDAKKIIEENEGV